MKFHFFQDPGHGWVRVPKKFIKNLGIADKISRSSYMRGDNVFLEEDGDCALFLKAMREKDTKVEFKEFHTDKSSKIRNYPIYEAEK